MVRREIVSRCIRQDIAIANKDLLDDRNQICHRPVLQHISGRIRSNDLSDHYSFVVHTQNDNPQLLALSLELSHDADKAALGRFLPVEFYHLNGCSKAKAAAEEREGPLSLVYGVGRRPVRCRRIDPDYSALVVEFTSASDCQLHGLA